MDPRKVSWMRPWTVPNTTVLYTEQELTEEQKAQARKNIGVGEGGSGGGSGGDGRGLKVIEAATIEELYNKIIALDNPVLFKVITDGSFTYNRHNGARVSASFAQTSTAGLITFEGMQCLAVSDYDFMDGASIMVVITFMDGNVLSLGYRYGNDVEQAGNLDFSKVTKFTAYYF